MSREVLSEIDVTTIEATHTLDIHDLCNSLLRFLLVEAAQPTNTSSVVIGVERIRASNTLRLRGQGEHIRLRPDRRVEPRECRYRGPYRTAD